MIAETEVFLKLLSFMLSEREPMTGFDNINFAALIFKIYTGDYSKEGYSRGFIDRKRGKPKQGWGVFKEIHPVNFVWKFNESVQSYNSSYKAGYLDRQRVENEVYRDQPPPSAKPTGFSHEKSPVNVTSNTLSKQQSSLGANQMSIGQDSYQNQLRLIRHARNNLQTFRRQLYDLSQRYQQQIRAAESAGYMQDMIEPLRKRYSQFAVKIDQLDNMISKHDNLIKDHEDKIVRLMNEASD